MNHKSKVKQFTKVYPFLGIYQPFEQINDHTFHYFTEPQPGYQKVSLHRKSARKPLSMFYEKIDLQEYRQHLKQQTADNSTIIDFQYFSTRESGQGEQTIIDSRSVVRESQWVRKYEPTKFIELLSDDKINRNMLTWLKSWDHIVFNKPIAKKEAMTPSMFNRNLNGGKFNKTGESSYLESIFSNPRKMILLAGPPGCGKTTLMRVLANHCKYEVIEINASDDRSANNLISKIQDIAGNDTLRGNKKPALICLDQIDGVVQGQASGISKVLEFIENGKKQKSKKTEQDQKKQKPKSGLPYVPSKEQKPMTFKKQNDPQTGRHLNRPVIFICNDPFAKSLKQLRSKAHVVYFNELNPDRIVKRMKEILEKEKIHIQLQVLQKICQICRNDVRSSIGVLELVTRQKKLNNKNPKDIISRMKLSFAKDNQSSINQFLQELFTKKTQYSSLNSSVSVIKHLESQVMEIYNPSLLMETFLHNFLNVQGIFRKFRSFLDLCNDLVKSDVLIKNGFRLQSELQNFHVLPYLGFSFNFGQDEAKKIEFPSQFFERLRKIKWNKQILKTIHENVPLQLRVFVKRESMPGPYLLALYNGMQTPSTKQNQIIRCVSLMLTYGFSFKKEKSPQQGPPIFNPEIDTLLAFGSKKPQILITQTSKVLMEQNYIFFKDRKEMLVDHELKDSTTAMVNQLNLQSRRKKVHEAEGLKYKFQEGTGTKTSYNLTISFFL